MGGLPELFAIAQHLASQAITHLQDWDFGRASGIVSVTSDSRETKFDADLRLNDYFHENLADSGIPVLSEESPLPVALHPRDPLWILDPLDGSVNFSRRSGPYAVSLALWQGSQPLFGVVARGDCPAIYAGGQGFPSMRNGRSIRVSGVSDRARATVATGLPARFDLSKTSDRDGLLTDISGFAKVRMLGSAAVSLCMLAEGAVDCYAERGIMLWDVAAGLAIVEGAGGIAKPVGNLLDPLTSRAGNGLVFA